MGTGVANGLCRGTFSCLLSGRLDRIKFVQFLSYRRALRGECLDRFLELWLMSMSFLRVLDLDLSGIVY